MFARRRSNPRVRSLALAALSAACLVLLAPAPPARSSGWLWPVDGEVLTTYRNGTDPYAGGQHRGIDIAAPGGTSVRSVAAGEITYAGRLPEYGYCVTLASGRHLISFLHLRSVAVSRGAAVRAGAVIGVVGTTGTRSATAPHLHLGVRLASTGAYVDPLPLLGPRPVAEVPTSEGSPVAKPLAAQPPTAKQRTQAQSRGDARARDNAARERSTKRIREQSNRRAPGDSHSRSGSRSTQRRSRPSQPSTKRVHAPPPGDTIAAVPANAAASSAREGRASRGRAAPPPASSANGPQRLTDSAVAGEDVHDGTIEQAAVPPGPSDRSSLPWKLFALVTGAGLAIVLFWRRRGTGHDTGPLEGDDRVLIERPELGDSPVEEASTVNLRIVGQ